MPKQYTPLNVLDHVGVKAFMQPSHQVQKGSGSRGRIICVGAQANSQHSAEKTNTGGNDGTGVNNARNHMAVVAFDGFATCLTI